MKHLQTIILSLVVLGLALFTYYDQKVTLDRERLVYANQEEAYKIDAALKERIDMLYRAHSNVELDLEKQKTRITALENRPRYTPLNTTNFGYTFPTPTTNNMVYDGTNFIMAITNSRIWSVPLTDVTNLGTPVLPSLEEQRVIEETLKQ